jgi:tRNA 2-thiouridine synthesizing protein A
MEYLDTCGLIFTEPIIKLAVKAPDIARGDVLEINGDSPTFEKDIKLWCRRLGYKITKTEREGEYKRRIRIQF